MTLLQAGANAARNALLLGRLTANFRIASPSPTGTRFETDSFPLGVWGAPKTLGAAVQALPSTDVVRAGNRVVLVAGISATAIGPAIDYYRVEASRRPLPLHATGATRTAFLKTSRDLNLPIPATAAEALSLAEATLFPDRVNVLADGQHSALARAAYRRDRSAPPRIGSLTDGLARRNGTDGERSIMDRVEQPVPIARPPYVTGLLLSGVGAVADRPLTTVANKRTKRRPAPTVESVHGRLGRVLPVTLTRSAQPGFAKAGTIIATDGAPRTDTVGTTASYSGGRIGAPSLAGLVAGIGAKRAPNEMRARRAPSSGGSGADVAQPGRRLRSGDLVVLQRPDAQLDTDTQRRPSVTIDGSARIVVTAGRIVLDDVVVTNSSHQIQPGASLVGVHADGGADVICAGWTTRSRLARLGTHLAIGTGCTLSVDAAGTSPSLKWALGQEVVDGASEVVTRFAQPVSTIAIVVTGDAPSSLLPAELNLVGARPASDDRGVVRPPIAVALGPSTVLLHEIVRTDSVNGTGNLTGNEATNGGNDTTVRVVTRRGGTYDITGVLGSKLPARELALLLAREGVDAVLSKLLATSGNGAAVSWIPADRPRKRYANRKGKSR